MPQQLSHTSGLDTPEKIYAAINDVFTQMKFEDYTVSVHPLLSYGRFGWEQSSDRFDVKISHKNLQDDAWRGVVRGGPNETLLIQSGMGWQLIRGDLPAVGETGLMWAGGEGGARPFYTGIQSFVRRVVTSLGEAVRERDLSDNKYDRTTANEAFYRGLQYSGITGKTGMTGAAGEVVPGHLPRNASRIESIDSPGQIRFLANLYNVPIVGDVQKSIDALHKQLQVRGSKFSSSWARLFGGGVWRAEEMGGALFVPPSAAGTLYEGEGEKTMTSMLSEKFLKRAYESERRQIAVPTIVTQGRVTPVPPEYLHTASVTLRGDIPPSEGIQTSALTAVRPLPWQSGQMQVRLPELLRKLIMEQGGMMEAGVYGHREIELGGLTGITDLISGKLKLDTGLIGRKLETGQSYTIGTLGTEKINDKVVPGQLGISFGQQIPSISGYKLHIPREWAATPELMEEIEPFIKQLQEQKIGIAFDANKPYLDVNLLSTSIASFKGEGAKGQGNMPLGDVERQIAGAPVNYDIIQESKNVDAVMLSALQALPTQGKSSIYNLMGSLYRGYRGTFREMERAGGQATLQDFADVVGFKTPELMLYDITSRALGYKMTPEGEWEAQPFEKINQRLNQFLLGRFGIGRVQGSFALEQYTPSSRRDLRAQVMTALQRDINPDTGVNYTQEEAMRQWRNMNKNMRIDRSGEIPKYTLYTAPQTEFIRTPKLQTIVPEYGGVGSDQGNIERALEAQGYGELLGYFKKYKGELFQNTPAREAIQDILAAQYSTNIMAPAMHRGAVTIGGPAGLDPTEILDQWHIFQSQMGENLTDVQRTKAFQQALQSVLKGAGVDTQGADMPFFFQSSKVGSPSAQSILDIESKMYELRPGKGEAGAAEWELTQASQAKATTRWLNIISSLLQGEAWGSVDTRARARAQGFYENYAFSDRIRKMQGGIYAAPVGSGMVPAGYKVWTERALRRNYLIQGGNPESEREYTRYLKKMEGAVGIDIRPPYPNVGTEGLPGSFAPHRIVTPYSKLGRTIMADVRQAGIETGEIVSPQSQVANLGDLDVDRAMYIAAVNRSKRGRWRRFDPQEETYGDLTKRIVQMSKPETQAATFENIFGALANEFDPFSQQIQGYVAATMGKGGLGLLEKRLVREGTSVQEQIMNYNEQKGIRMGSDYNTYLRRLAAESTVLGIPDRVATEMSDALSQYYQFAVDMKAKETLFESLVGTGGFFMQRESGQLQYGAHIDESFKNIGKVWNPTQTDASRLIQFVAKNVAFQRGNLEIPDTISAKGLASLFVQKPTLAEGATPEEKETAWRERWQYATGVLETAFGTSKDRDTRITPVAQAVNRLVEEGVFGVESRGGMAMLSRAVEFAQTDPTNARLENFILGSKTETGAGALKIGGGTMTGEQLIEKTLPARLLYQFMLAKSEKSDLYMNPIKLAQTFLYAQQQGVAGSSHIQQLWRTYGIAAGIPNPAESQLSLTNPLTGQQMLIDREEQLGQLEQAVGQALEQINVQGPTRRTLLSSVSPWHVSEIAHLSSMAEGKGQSFSKEIRMGLAGRFISSLLGVPDVEESIFRETLPIREGIELEKQIAPRIGAHTGAAGREKGLAVQMELGQAENLPPGIKELVTVKGMPDVLKAYRDEKGKAILEVGDIKRSRPRGGDLPYRRQVAGYAELLKYASKEGSITEEGNQITLRDWLEEVGRPAGLDVDVAMEAIEQGNITGALYYGKRAMRSPVDIQAALPQGLRGMLESARTYMGETFDTAVGELGVELEGTRLVPEAAQALRRNWRNIERMSQNYPIVSAGATAPAITRTASEAMAMAGMPLPGLGGGGGSGGIGGGGTVVAGAEAEPSGGGGSQWFLRQLQGLINQALGGGATSGVTGGIPDAEYIDRLFQTTFGQFAEELKGLGGGTRFIGGGGRNQLSKEAATTFVSKAAEFISQFGKESGGQLTELGPLGQVAGNIKNIMSEFFANDEGIAKSIREAATPFEAQGIGMRAGGVPFMQYLKEHPLLKEARGMYRSASSISKIAAQNLGNADANVITELTNRLGTDVESFIMSMAGQTPTMDAPAYQQVRTTGALYDLLQKELSPIPAMKKAERPLTPIEQAVMRDWGEGLIASTEEIKKQTDSLRQYKGGMLELNDVIKKASGETDDASKRIMKLYRTLDEVKGQRILEQQALGRELGLPFGAEKLTPAEQRMALQQNILQQGDIGAFKRYRAAAIKEEETYRDIFATFQGEDEESVRQRNYSMFARRALGGFGLMYMRSIAGIMAQPMMFGYQEGEAQQQAIAASMGGLYGGIAPVRTQEIAYQNAMAMYGGAGWAQMRGAYANLLRREPGVATLGNAAVSGVGVAGALATLGMWANIPALGSAAVLGPVGLGAAALAVGAQGYAANLDVEGSSIRMAQMAQRGDIAWAGPGGNRPYVQGNILQQIGEAFAAPILGYTFATLPGAPKDVQERAQRQRQEAQFLSEAYDYVQGGGNFREFLRSRGQIGREAYWQQQYTALLPGIEQFANVPIQGIAQAQMLSTMLGANLQQYAPGFEQLGYALSQGVPVYETARGLAAQPGLNTREQRELTGQLIQGWYGPGGGGLTSQMIEQYQVGGQRLAQLGIAGMAIKPRDIYSPEVKRTTPEWTTARGRLDVLTGRLSEMDDLEYQAYQRRMALQSTRAQLGLTYEAIQPESYIGLTPQQVEQRQREDIYTEQRLRGLVGIQQGFMGFGVQQPQMQAYDQYTNIQMNQVQAQQQWGMNFGQTLLQGGAAPGFANAFGLTMANLNPQQFWQYSQMMQGNPQVLAGYALQNPQAWSQIGGLTGIGGTAINPQSLVAVDIKMVDGKPVQTGMAWGTSSLAMPGISSAAMAGQLFAQTGMRMGGGSFIDALIQGGTMGGQMWQLGRQAQYQQATAGIQLAQIALQEKYQPLFWSVEDRMKEATRGQSLWQLDFQQRQMQMQNQFFYQNMGLQQRQMEMQRGWSREDWAFQDMTRAMQWGWRVEDFSEQRRFLTGRERGMAEKQIGRETIMHDLEGAQIDKQRKRQEEMWAVEDERMLLQVQQHEAQLAMQEESLQKTREYYQETWALQDEQTDLQRAYWREQIELQKASAGAAAAYAKDMQDVAKAMEIMQQKAQVMAGERSLMNPDTMTQLAEQLATVDPLFSSMFVESLGQLGDHLENMADNYTMFRMNTGNLSTILDQLNPAYEQFVELIRQTAEIITGKEVTVGTGGGGGGGGGKKAAAQHGALAMAGNVYQINEDGTEYFKPWTSGEIIPSHKTNPWMNETYIWDSGKEKGNLTVIIKVGEEEIKRKVLEFVSQEVD